MLFRLKRSSFLASQIAGLRNVHYHAHLNFFYSHCLEVFSLLSSTFRLTWSKLKFFALLT
jgi:hypothetical protein